MGWAVLPYCQHCRNDGRSESGCVYLGPILTPLGILVASADELSLVTALSAVCCGVVLSVPKYHFSPFGVTWCEQRESAQRV